MFRITVIWSGQSGSFPNKQQLILKWPAPSPPFLQFGTWVKIQKWTRQIYTRGFNCTSAMDTLTLIWTQFCGAFSYEVHMFFLTCFCGGVVENNGNVNGKWSETEFENETGSQILFEKKRRFMLPL